MNRNKELEYLKIELFAYSFNEPYAFANLLKRASRIFPILDQEISSVYPIHTDTVYLWRTGSLIPNSVVQEEVVRYIKYRLEKEIEKQGLEKQGSLVASPVKPVQPVIESSIPFYVPWFFQLKAWWNSLGVSWKSSNISSENFANLLERVEFDREVLLRLRVNRSIAKCNREIIKAIRKNQLSILFEVGKGTAENVRIAHSIKEYLADAGFSSVDLNYEHVTAANSASLFLEISLEK